MAKQLKIPADYQSLDEARELIHWTGRETGFDDAAIHDIKLAATEALANAIEHGTASDGLVRIRVTSGDDELGLEISGGGRPELRAPPAKEPPSGRPNSRRGRGIAIMSALMDEVAFKRDGDETLIRLAKRRTPSSTTATD